MKAEKGKGLILFGILISMGGMIVPELSAIWILGLLVGLIGLLMILIP